MADNDQEAPHAAPHDEAAKIETQHAELAAEGERHEASPPADELSPPAPVRKKRGLGQKLTLAVSALGLLATLAGGAAIVFEDRDPRLRNVADSMEAAAKDPLKFLHEQEDRLGAWLMTELPRGETPPAKLTPAKPEPEKSEPGKLGPLSPRVTGVRPAEEPPKSDAPTGWATPREIQPPTKTEATTPETAVKAEPPKPDAPKIETPKPVAPPPAAAKSAPQVEAPVELGGAEIGAEGPTSHEIAALKSRLSTLEENLREARDAAMAAQAAASGRSDGGAEKSASPEVKDKLSTLQSRVEDLAEAVEGFRAQLDQPKVDTRAAAEVQQAAGATQSKALTALETMALAHSLRTAFIRGEPYAGELAALQARGTDPDLVAKLAPFAERGAPEAKDLLAMFLPIGKRLRAIERPDAPAGSLSDQLLRDAEKLVRVRPVTQAAPNTAEELVPTIERALAHDDLAAASAAVAKLPELAKGDAKLFADALEARVAGEKASTELLRQSVAALGRDKN